MAAAPLIVLGSANRDYAVVVDRIPKPGETVLGGPVVVRTGGKGANQAAAVARAGVTPIFVAAVGDDSVGSEILVDLAAVGIDVSHVSRSKVATGVALITVAHDGENSIVVSAGANGTLEPGPTGELVGSLLTPAAVLLAQLEIPVAVVAAAAIAAEKAGARFVLNLSPSISVPSKMLAAADPLVVNEAEGSELANSQIDSAVDAQAIARRLLATSRSVVITLGGDGVVFADAEGVHYLPAPRVRVVDTTGAGDAFAGALAAALAEALPLAAAVARGIDAGAAAVQYVGAQPPH
jgi:ribokinase